MPLNELLAGVFGIIFVPSTFALRCYHLLVIRITDKRTPFCKMSLFVDCEKLFRGALVQRGWQINPGAQHL
jgi:hypothetical protein